MEIQLTLMWGVLAFLLSYALSIGSAISTVPSVLQALLSSDTYGCLLVGALSLVVHIALGSMVEPCVMDHRLRMSTLVMLLSLLVWGWLLGPMRMLLSVPLASVRKIWMETTIGGGKLAILLGPGYPESQLPG